MERLRREAIEAAVRGGARREDVKIVRVEKLPLAYVTDNSTRIIISAVGSLAPPNLSEKSMSPPTTPSSVTELDEEEELEAQKEAKPDATGASPVKPSSLIHIPSYRPEMKKGI